MVFLYAIVRSGGDERCLLSGEEILSLLVWTILYNTYKDTVELI
jgi:hypothetical protein